MGRAWARRGKSIRKPVMRDLSISSGGARPPTGAAWKNILAQYQRPSPWRAVWQIINTVGPYAVLWWLMYVSLNISWWLTLPLAVLAGVFLVRVFIIFHDCGHGSFFKSRKANEMAGIITG